MTKIQLKINPDLIEHDKVVVVALPCEVDVGVCDGGGQRTRDDSAKVDDENPPPTMNHFQWDAQNQLNYNVEDDVEVATVDEHVREEPPDFPLLVRVEDQRPRQVRRSVGPHCDSGVGQEDDVPDEDANLCQGNEKQKEWRWFTTVFVKVSLKVRNRVCHGF